MPYGGGKAVIAVSEVPGRGSDDRRELLLRYAEIVDSLHGTYVTAADMNTGEADMDTIWERTQYVLGRSKAYGVRETLGRRPRTGVFHGIRASIRHAFESDDVEGRSVGGVGSVGGRLADHLDDAGAELLVADVDPSRAP